MTDTPGATPPAGQTSERMQALLAQFQEEQVSEQRTVSTLLTELRGQVGALTEGVRHAASDASVERLAGIVSSVVADLRTSTSLLGQRIEALSKRVDAVGQDTAAPTEQAAVRLTALTADIAAQTDAVEQMKAALETLAGFPSALAALQKDVAGLHDRVQPLAEVRSTVADIGTRTASSLQALQPQLDALQTKVDAIGVVPDPERLRDAVVDALTGRLDKLQEAAERPVIGPDVLKSDLGDLRASLDGALGDRLEEMGAGLGAVENRLGQIGERLADVGDAAGGIPALSTDLTRLAGRVEELQALHGVVGQVGSGVQALRDDTSSTSLALGIASLRDDIDALAERVAATAPPPIEEIAAMVSQRVADRLVETLAPRIADVVLTRVSAALVTQLGEALSPRVKADTELVVRTATADSERRVLAHVDESVLALAEALLRRRRGGRPAGTASSTAAGEPAASAEPEPAGSPSGAALSPVASDSEAEHEEPLDDNHGAPDEAVQDIVDKINALDGADLDEPSGVASAQVDTVEEAAELTSEPEQLAVPLTDDEAQPTPETEDGNAEGQSEAGAEPAGVVDEAPAPAAAPAPARPSVTTGMAPTPSRATAVPSSEASTQVGTVTEGAEPTSAEGDGESPRAAHREPVVLSKPEPAVLTRKPGSGTSPAEPPQGRPSSAPSPVVRASQQAGEALKPAARAQARPAAPPVKTSMRPISKPVSKPILDRTPDLPDDVDEPVRSEQVRPRPMTRSSPPPPVQQPSGDRDAQGDQGEAARRPPPAVDQLPAGNQPPEPPEPPEPIPSAFPTPLDPPPTEKRKPWWRPGG